MPHALKKALLSLPATALTLGLVVLLWPRDAWAWGPLAHLDFSTGALGQLGSLPAVFRVLLTKCADDFLYGSLAADIIVGKNLARYAVHCHNWKIGWKVFDHAKGEPQKAFALGFLAHLAADTVAHNYYVPFKTVAGFRKRGTGHAYWELRYDQKLDPSLWQTARRISTAKFRKHDEFLEEALSDSYVIPFGLSKKVFEQLLVAARMKKYQAMCSVVAKENDELPLTDHEVAEVRQLAVEQIVGMLAHREESRSNTADPTGGRNLHLAVKLRQQLREARRTDQLDPRDAERILAEARPAFREAIHGKLVLPDLHGDASHAAIQAVRAASEDTERASDEEIEAETIEREAAEG